MAERMVDFTGSSELRVARNGQHYVSFVLHMVEREGSWKGTVLAKVYFDGVVNIDAHQLWLIRAFFQPYILEQSKYLQYYCKVVYNIDSVNWRYDIS